MARFWIHHCHGDVSLTSHLMHTHTNLLLTQHTHTHTHIITLPSSLLTPQHPHLVDRISRFSSSSFFSFVNFIASGVSNLSRIQSPACSTYDNDQHYTQQTCSHALTHSSSYRYLRYELQHIAYKVITQHIWKYDHALSMQLSGGLGGGWGGENGMAEQTLDPTFIL